MRSSRSPAPRPCSAETGDRLAEPERVERGGVGLLRVRRRPCSRPRSTGTRRAAEAAGERGVLLGDARLRVDDQQDQVGLGRGAVGLVARRAPRCRARIVHVARRCRPDANRRPRHVASSSTRSRVTPGMSWAIASRRPNSRFTSVDFPTFCRPTTATRAGCAPARSRDELRRAARATIASAAASVSSTVEVGWCRCTTASSAGSSGFVRASRASRSRAAPSRPRPRSPPRAARHAARHADRASAVEVQLDRARRGTRPSRCLDPPSPPRPSPSARWLAAHQGRGPRDDAPRATPSASTSSGHRAHGRR